MEAPKGKPPPGDKPSPAPAISLPKGGGAIRGIGEKFAANPVTGTGSMTVPIATSPGRSGFGPQLSLSYDSGTGNGPFGFGWSLSLPSITRKTDKGLPRYQDAAESDEFILSGAEDLVPVVVRDGDGWKPETLPPRKVNGVTYKVCRYRPRIEGLFARIERWTNEKGGADTFWRSISKDNITTWYGRTAESRIADPADATRIFSWLICESHDDKGNVIAYRYDKENSTWVDTSQANERNRTDQTRSVNRYLKRVFYGNRTPYFPKPVLDDPPEARDQWLFEVVFDYGEHDQNAPGPEAARAWPYRGDPFSSYRAGFEVRTYRLCQRVLMFHHFSGEPGVGADCLVRSTDFAYSYEQNPADARNPIFTSLLSVTQCGYRRQNGGYLKKSLPPLEFAYSQVPTCEELAQQPIEEVDPASLENLPMGLDGGRYQWVDLDGEGLSGILTEQAEGWFYKRNVSPINTKKVNHKEKTVAHFAPMELVARRPSPADLNGGRQQFLDLAGDGQVDLVQLAGPLSGYYERTTEGGWVTFVPFTSAPNLVWNDPNLKFVDLTGDGHADVLITEDDVLTWHPSLAEAGFGPAEMTRQAADEEKGPRLVFADGAQSIYLADMSGDGLTDLARIRNGEVCYWPNLGYGRFGAKVTMNSAPCFDRPDQFDQRRIRLADVDGSGTTDILYLASDGVRLFFNQSGNGWGKEVPLRQFPRIDNVSSVQAMDLLGNGTACLVWSSSLPGDAGRQMRYIDLMGGQKPHLLVKVVNNLGAETHIEYASSTRFYLADKERGHPWITRLPFPVHVVERVQTYDWISRNRFVTRYEYHHGYFDGAEREFRGFGRVDQRDTEEFAALSATGDFPAGSNLDAASHMPPVLTKTWFHTGAHFEGGLISRQFDGEYYREGDSSLGEAGLDPQQMAALRLDDTVFSGELSAEEQREACHSLKGSILRQETYGQDDTEEADRPYSVSERSYTIQRVQPLETNKHAVFFTHPRETIDFHYERKLADINGKKRADPRVSHTLTLKMDDYGNVERSIAVGYRRREAPDLQDPEQEATHLTLTVSRFANYSDEEDWYRVGLPVETRTYEIVKPPEPHLIGGLVEPFDFDAMRGLLEGRQEGAIIVEGLLPSDSGEPKSTKLWPYEKWDWRQNAANAPSETKLRLIEHVRTVYRSDDLTGPLKLGQVQSLGLPYDSYKLAFTPDLLAKVFRRPLDVIQPPGAPPPESLLPAPGHVLPIDSGTGQVADRGGYDDLDGNGAWWIPSGRIFYSPSNTDSAAQELDHARKHFFLPHRFRDPFGATTTVTYDRPRDATALSYDLLILETVDPLGNRVTVGERAPTGAIDPAKRGNDYRVLQPWRVMDPNGNRTQVAFDALGMVVGTAVMGKPAPAPVEGDSLDGFEADQPQAQIDAFYDVEDPHVPAPGLLKDATTRIVYDLGRFQRTQQAYPEDPTQWLPLYAATLARETHASDPSPPGGLEIQISFSYSDGFGREIQKKIQAEPRPLVEGGPTVTPQWVGGGWTIFNNKGKPVRQYESFFSQLAEKRHRFEFGAKYGVSPVLFYDPLERVVATLHPNHTFEKVVFDPWQQITYDVNDTVLNLDGSTDPKSDEDVKGFFERLPDEDYLPTWYEKRSALPANDPERVAANKAAVHRQTPTVACLDTLGRTFLTIAHNRFARNNAIVEEKYATRVELDIEGNQRAVVDVMDRVVMRYDYDMLGNRIHQASMEAGERWMLEDVMGKLIRAWDSRGFIRRMTYDELRRPTGLHVTENGTERLAEQTIYGEVQGDAGNHRTRVWQVRDGAGVVTNEAYDLKGNLLRSKRELLSNYAQMVDWSKALIPNAGTFATHTTYDALNRPTTQTTPDSSVTRYTYNEASLLDTVDVTLPGAAIATPFVANINYNAKGQRELTVYANSAQTEYDYDPLTYRLSHLKTTRPAGLNGPAARIFVDPAVVQDLHYTYDAAGNITRIADAALKQIVHNNEQVEPVCSYTYDAIYRLIEARGREHIGQTAHEFVPPDGNRRDCDLAGLVDFITHPDDMQAMRNYNELYEYDAVGNFDKVRHGANGGNWTRRYDYDEASLIETGKQSNRLTRTAVGNGLNHIETYSYADAQGNDVQGCMTAINSMKMVWDFEDRLQQIDLGGGGRAYYVYDAVGQRVRKVVESQNGTRQHERVYLGGYEIYRQHLGQYAGLVRETLHVMDDKQRIALVETRNNVNDGTLPQVMRYQFGNHLGSASVELDTYGAVISHEEYYPSGATAFQTGRSAAEVSLKRYRFTGRERDEESGLYYHGARYYAPWLGRWTACDPTGLVDGINLYAYVRSNPVRLVDPEGTDSRQDALNYHVELIKEGARKLAGIQGGKHLKGFGVPVPIRLVEGKRVTIEGGFDPEFWEPRSELDPTSKSGMLRLKEGKKPSDAIRAIVERPDKWYLDCATFLQVSMLYARLEEVADTAQFDREMRAKGKKTGGIFLRSHRSSGLDVEREWSFEKKSNKVSGSSTGNKPLSPNVMAQRIAAAPLGSLFTFQNLKTSEESSVHLENTIFVGKTRSGERLFLAWGPEPPSATKHIVFTEMRIRQWLASVAERKQGVSVNPRKDIRVKWLGYFPSP